MMETKPLSARLVADKRAPSHRRIWLGSFVLVLVGIVLGHGVAEIALRIFAPQPMSGVMFEYAPRGYSVNRSSGSALFTVGENTGSYHFVWPHLRGVQPPPAHAARIIALGDSFTFGWGLPEQDTTVVKLQEKIDAAFGRESFALLNAGIGGSGTAEHMAFLEDYGDIIAPRAVIVFVNYDDFNRAQRSPLYRLRDANTLELVEGQAPRSTLKQLVSHSRLYDFAIQHSHLAQLMRNVVLRILYPPSPASMSTVEHIVEAKGSSPDQQRLARALFRRMKAWCDQRGVKLAVINNGWRPYEWLSDLLSSEGITGFDATAQIQPVIAGDVAPYVLSDGHPNRRGAKVIADAVWPFLRDFISRNGLGDASG